MLCVSAVPAGTATGSEMLHFALSLQTACFLLGCCGKMRVCLISKKRNPLACDSQRVR
jgi:hypothetical protein